MTNIYEAAVAALTAHWAAHNNQYPQKLVLSAAHHAELMRLRQTGTEGLNADPSKLDLSKFMGVPVVIEEGASSALIVADGTAQPLGG